MEIVLEASHTHLYPGHEGRVTGAGALAHLPVNAQCRVDFADGGVAFATLSHGDDGAWVLEAGVHATSAGTSIPAKRWRVALREDGGTLRFRILGRIG